MTESILEELRGAVRSRYLVGILVEECLNELQSKLRSTVYFLYREFSRNDKQTLLNPALKTSSHFPCSIADVEVAKNSNLMVARSDQVEKPQKDESISQIDDTIIPKIRDSFIQTDDVKLLTTTEEDMLEEIVLDSDDETQQTGAPDEQTKAGIEYSKLNKQIMNVMKEFSIKNVGLFLYKILRILVQDRNIIFRDTILQLVDRQCQKEEIAASGISTQHLPGVSRNMRSVAVNTDWSGPVERLPSPKRNVAAPIRFQPISPYQKQAKVNETLSQSGVLQKSATATMVHQPCNAFNVNLPTPITKRMQKLHYDHHAAARPQTYKRHYTSTRYRPRLNTPQPVMGHLETLQCRANNPFEDEHSQTSLGINEAPKVLERSKPYHLPLENHQPQPMTNNQPIPSLIQGQVKNVQTPYAMNTNAMQHLQAAENTFSPQLQQRNSTLTQQVPMYPTPFMNTLSPLNQMGQGNQLYANPASMQQINPPIMQMASGTWDAQMHGYTSNYPQPTPQYDAYGRYP